jgi:hypothetical protein
MHFQEKIKNSIRLYETHAGHKHSFGKVGPAMVII